MMILLMMTRNDETPDPEEQDNDSPDSQSNEGMLLERFPLNRDEMKSVLEVALTTYQQTRQILTTKRFSFPELDVIFQQSMDRVFIPGNPVSPHDNFLETVVSLCGRRGERFLYDALYQYATATETMTTNQNQGHDFPNQMATLLYKLCFVFQKLQQQESLQDDDDDAAFNIPLESPSSWVDMLQTWKANPSTSSAEWREWASYRIPLVHQILSTVFSHVLLGKGNSCSRRSMPPFPFAAASSSILSSVDARLAFQLGLMDLGGSWKRLFDSSSDGLFFRTFQEALTGYCGPTLILIRTNNREVLGYFSDVPWKMSSTWYSGGEGGSFLFRLFPFWNIYRPIVPGSSSADWKFHQFLNLSKNTRLMNGIVGCAVGGVSADAPRLHITTDLEQCKASSFDSVFEAGPLLASDDEWLFDVDSLEVWAVRIEEDSWQRNMEAGRRKASVKESLRKHMATVDRRQFVDDFSSGNFMNHLYGHRDQVRGRADFVVADDEREGYYLQDKAPSERTKLTGKDNT